MTGLEKMKSQILEEAHTCAEKILEDTRKEADEILAEAKKRAEAECSRISQNAEEEVKNLAERSESSCALQRRKALLEAKQEIISEVLEKAYETLISADETTYFGMLRKMLYKYVLPEEGEICFSKEDLEKMTPGFEEEIKGIAKEKGGALTISKETRNVKGGFVLVYGGIEENCTFKAMFHSQKDELSDKVHSLLFS